MSLNGSICSPIGFKQNIGKKAFAFFQMFAKGIYKCVCFEEVAEYARDSLRRGDSVFAAGYVSQKTEGEEFIIETLVHDKKAHNSTETTLVGSDKEAFEAFEKTMEKTGNVKVKDAEHNFSVWKPKDDCVEINGRWVLKIDYIMDVFGATKVNRILRQNVRSLIMNRLESIRYKEWLNKMVDRARSLETNKES